MRRHRTRIGLLAAAAVTVGAAVVAAGSPASAGGTAWVLNGNDAGPGSFREAVDDANDGNAHRIVFRRGVEVDLESEVRYTGDRDLTIFGRGSSVNGTNGDAGANETWASGLFVAETAADIAIRDLDFEDSFNNGIAFFVDPAATGRVSLSLRNVEVEGAKFHGIFFDDQTTTGFNTDDEPHPACVDPYESDSPASLHITLSRVSVTDAGNLKGGFDISLETGCPQDFDGVRVDDGLEGDISASIRRSHFDDNLADGVELDEKGNGSVIADVWKSTFVGNGETEPVFNAGGDEFDDLDDGFDIDEADDGDIRVRVFHSTIDANFDEGLDFDEEGEGDAKVRVFSSTADDNEDEGIKVDEEDDGDLSLRIVDTSSSGALGNDGIQAEEADEGDLRLRVIGSEANANDGAGIKAEEGDEGDFSARIVNTDAKDNTDGFGIEAAQEAPGSGQLTGINLDLSGNSDGPTDIDPAEITATLINVNS